MREGHVEQVGTPDEVYAQPVSRYVARFIGSPQMDILSGELVREDDSLFYSIDDVRLPVPESAAPRTDRAIDLGVRPEHIRLGEEGTKATILVTQPLGSMTYVTVGWGQVLSIPRAGHGALCARRADRCHARSTRPAVLRPRDGPARARGRFPCLTKGTRHAHFWPETATNRSTIGPLHRHRRRPFRGCHRRLLRALATGTPSLGMIEGVMLVIDDGLARALAGTSGVRERRADILRLLDQHEFMDVKALAARFEITEASVRRDLISLEASGLLTRVRGGAVSHSGPQPPTRGYHFASQVRLEEKRRIAAAAAALIGPGTSAFLSPGTTAAHVAAAISPSVRSQSRSSRTQPRSSKRWPGGSAST